MSIRHTKGAINGDDNCFERQWHDGMYHALNVRGFVLFGDEIEDYDLDIEITPGEALMFTNWVMENRGGREGSIELPNAMALSMRCIAEVWLGISTPALSNFLSGTWKAPERVRAEAIDLVQHLWRKV
jgi:hypothetical protein